MPQGPVLKEFGLKESQLEPAPAVPLTATPDQELAGTELPTGSVPGPASWKESSELPTARLASAPQDYPSVQQAVGPLALAVAELPGSIAVAVPQQSCRAAEHLLVLVLQN